MLGVTSGVRSGLRRSTFTRTVKSGVLVKRGRSWCPSGWRSRRGSCDDLANAVQLVSGLVPSVEMGCAGQGVPAAARGVWGVHGGYVGVAGVARGSDDLAFDGEGCETWGSGACRGRYRSETNW